MLKSKLLHPRINEVLGRAGHGAKILIADGNFPASHTMGSRAELVSLNLSPGVVTCSEVLAVLASAVPIEEAFTMQVDAVGKYAIAKDPLAWKEFRQILQDADIQIALKPVERHKFYRLVATENHVLTIHTGDLRLFSNILISIGVVGVQ